MYRRSLIAIVISRWVAPFIFLYGIHLIIYGHLTPGGGFPGGVVLASSFILALLARGKYAALERLPYALAKKLDTTGAIIFILSAYMGLLFSGVFFRNFIHDMNPGTTGRLFSSGTILLNNIAIGIKVCASIFLIMLFLSVLRVGDGVDLETMEEE